MPGCFWSAVLYLRPWFGVNHCKNWALHPLICLQDFPSRLVFSKLTIRTTSPSRNIRMTLRRSVPSPRAACISLHLLPYTFSKRGHRFVVCRLFLVSLLSLWLLRRPASLPRSGTSYSHKVACTRSEVAFSMLQQCSTSMSGLYIGKASLSE